MYFVPIIETVFFINVKFCLFSRKNSQKLLGIKIFVVPLQTLSPQKIDFGWKQKELTPSTLSKTKEFFEKIT